MRVDSAIAKLQDQKERHRLDAAIWVWSRDAGHFSDEERLRLIDVLEPSATAQRAASWGLKVEHLRVTSPRPAKALVQIANERRAGLLVLGPKRKGIFRFWHAAREVVRNAHCLVWIAEY